MATTETYVPRLKTRYNDELRGQLQEQLELSSIMQSPTVAKITLNMGVGEGKTDAKQIDQALEELTIIAGQRAQVRRATLSSLKRTKRLMVDDATARSKRLQTGLKSFRFRNSR